MTSGPEGQAAATGAESSLRVSRADREQAIDALKTAFVQDRLTVEELVKRAGHALQARTYADLAAVTADLPAGLADPKSSRGAVRSGARRPVSKLGKAALWGASATPLAAVWTAIAVSGTEQFDRLGLMVVTATFGGWAAVLTVKFASWQERRSAKLPPARPQASLPS